MATSYYFLRIIKKKNVNNGDKTSDIAKKLCRICLKSGTVPIFSTNKTEDISEVVKAFAEIELDEKDSMPKFLCQYCYSLLQGAILFRKSAKDSYEKLKNKPNLTENAINLNKHKSTVESQTENLSAAKAFDCHRCKESPRKLSAVNHKQSKQQRNIRVQCPTCFGLLTAQAYKKHLIRHSASHIVCDVCGKLYRKDNLVRHLQLHKFDLPFQCQVCPYRGRFMESLKIHMRTHSGNKPFTCEKCELRFITRSNLNRHLLTHKKDKPHKCAECNRGFYTQKEANEHYKSGHAGIKGFLCQLCSSKYGTRKALMRHELRVHKRNKMTKGRVPLYLQEEFK